MTSRFRAEVLYRSVLTVSADNADNARGRAVALACERVGCSPDAIVDVTVELMTFTQNLDAANLRILQETDALELGTPSQRQRWASGCLPEEELRRLAHTELYHPLALLRRRTRKGPSVIPHPSDEDGTWRCVRSAVNGIVPVTWTTTTISTLTDAQWDAVTPIHAALDVARQHPWLRRSPPSSVRVLLRGHLATCDVCRRTYTDPAARVEIDWAGRTLSREYAL